MEAHKVTARVSGGRIVIDGLPFPEGEQVEIVLLRIGNGSVPSPPHKQAGSVIEYVDPFESAAGDDEWEALS